MSYDLIIAAIESAIVYCRNHDTLQPQSKAKGKRIHEDAEDEGSGSNSRNSSANRIVKALKAALLAKFGFPNDKAWQAINKDGKTNGSLLMIQINHNLNVNHRCCWKKGMAQDYPKNNANDFTGRSEDTEEGSA